jgi:hypothetical protein
MGTLYVFEKFRHGVIFTGESPRRRGGSGFAALATLAMRLAEGPGAP